MSAYLRKPNDRLSRNTLGPNAILAVPRGLSFGMNVFKCSCSRPCDMICNLPFCKNYSRMLADNEKQEPSQILTKFKSILKNSLEGVNVSPSTLSYLQAPCPKAMLCYSLLFLCFFFFSSDDEIS